MIERDYTPRREASRGETPRRSTASTPARRSAPSGGSYHRRPPKKSGPPPILYVGLLLIVAIVVVIVLFATGVFGGNKDPKPENSSQSTVSAGSAQSGSQASQVSSNPASQVSSTPSSQADATPKPKDMTNAKAEDLGPLLLVDGAGYEYYNFVESTANDYITTVTDAGTSLEGIATVYDMVIPTSMGILLPQEFIDKKGFNSNPQDKAINYLYSSVDAINPKVKTVPIYDALKAHSDEYIYFRTDHHWTQLGAYYAYEEFAKLAGFKPLALSEFEKKEYTGFLGSFYSDSGNNPKLETNPDTVEAYFPPCDTTMNVETRKDGPLDDWPLIYDDSDGEYSASLKYNVFIAGDNPYTEITNNDLSDGSSIVVVKESFGNAFVPFLAPHYQHIYVIDYRYWSGNVKELCTEKSVKNVLLLNNISMTRNDDLVSDLGTVF